MRAAAVQLTATADTARNLETADRLVRARRGATARARRAAREVARARPRRGPARGRRAARRPGADAGRAATARELGIDLVAGSIAERVDGGEREAAQHVACTSAPTARSARSTARSTCSTSRSAAASTASPTREAPGDEIVLTRAAGGAGLGPEHLLRPALPRALPRAGRARRARAHRARRVHPADDARPLGGAACAPARSRTRPSSSPPTRSASTRPACGPAGAR